MAFAFKVAITIDHAKVPNTNQTNFAVLVSGVYSYLATVANGGKVQNASGYDIGFYSDAALTTKLDWETEIYTAASGLVVYWVRIPSLLTATDTVIYLAYGDSSITTDQSNKNGVWNSAVKGAYNLGDGTTLSVADSTSNAANGTNNGATAAAGQIDGCAAFNGSSQYISMGNPSALQITGQITIACWVKLGAFPSNDIASIIDKGHNGTDSSYFLRIQDVSGTRTLEVGANVVAAWTISGWNTGEWHRVVGVNNGTNWIVYFDGVSKATQADSNGALSTAVTVSFGSALFNTTTRARYLNGSIDAARIVNTARSADWILTEYNNQSSPSTFYSLGSQQASAVGASSGVAACSGVGLGTISAVGAAAGTATCSGVAASTVRVVGSATGTGSATGIAASTVAAVGSAPGVGAAAGVAASTISSVGAAQGTSSVSGIGASTVEALGSAAGISIVSGVGDSETPSSSGAAAGISTVLGVGASTVAAVGLAVCGSLGDARGSSTAASVGSAAGICTVVGVNYNSVVSALLPPFIYGFCRTRVQGSVTLTTKGVPSGTAQARVRGSVLITSRGLVRGTNVANVVLRGGLTTRPLLYGGAAFHVVVADYEDPITDSGFEPILIQEYVLEYTRGDSSVFLDPGNGRWKIVTARPDLDVYVGALLVSSTSDVIAGQGEASLEEALLSL